MIIRSTISDSDKFHIGSNVEAISAMMIPTKLAEGQATETKLLMYFLNLVDRFLPEFESITNSEITNTSSGHYCI
ncbi:MAG: hypothetical protein IPH97_10320 [Ignavibacteriales bacterium]|nr:hypothetical protein [Ignavibacteriales bacterium]